MTDLRPHIKAHGTAGTVADHIRAGGKVRQRNGGTPVDVRVAANGWIRGRAELHGYDDVAWVPNGALAGEDGNHPLDLLPVEPPAAGEPVGYMSPGSVELLRAGKIDAAAIYRHPAYPPDMDENVPLYTAPAGDELVAGLRFIRAIFLAIPFTDSTESESLFRRLVEINDIARALLAKHGGGE